MTRGGAAGTKRGEAGYALVAAVASIAVFALLALALATQTRATIASASAEITQARAGLAADSGIALAVHGLLTDDPAVTGALDGRPYQTDFDGAALTIILQDETGLVPLHQLEEVRATLLLEGAGLTGDALAIARDSLLDWTDEDDIAIPNGAEFSWYAQQGIIPPNANLRSVDELAKIRGFSPQLVERLRPYVTADPNVRLFDARFADPRAIAVMVGEGAGSVAAVVRAREHAGQRTALAFNTSQELIGRPVVIRVIAELDAGGRASRETVVTLTRSARRPFVLRDYR